MDGASWNLAGGGARRELARGATAAGARPPGPWLASPARSQYWDDVREVRACDRDRDLHPHLQEALAAAADAMGRPQHSAADIRRRISSGLIVVRTPAQSRAARDPSGGRSEYQAVVVQGRVSYAFSEFVQSRYPHRGARRADAVRQLVSHMTLDERRVVATLEFSQMWDHARGPSSPLMEGASTRTENVYAFRRARFVELWLSDPHSADELLRLLSHTPGVGCARWEFPKGKRVSGDESDLACSLREFREETRIPGGSYRLLPGFCRVEAYVHMDVLYVNTYYLAVLTEQIPDPASSITMSHHEQLSEVADVRWLGLDGMRHVSGPVGRDLTTMGRAAFRYVRAYMGGNERRGRAAVRPAFHGGPARFGGAMCATAVVGHDGVDEYEGASNEGASNGGASNEGASNGGASNEGASHGGASHGDASNEGASNEGASNGGASNEGAPHGDASNEGAPHGDASNEGASNEGAPHGDASNEGAPHGDASNEGAPHGDGPKTAAPLQGRV